MSVAADRLAALVGSRLCHDLISPVGAVGNGIELLQLQGGGATPEFDLLRQSAEAAGARLRFCRVAFGNAAGGEGIAGAELAHLIAGVFRPGRLIVTCDIGGGLPRAEAKLALLMVLCLETMMPHGGHLTLRRDDADLVVEGATDRWRRDMDALWALLDTNAATAETMTPSMIHLPLAAIAADTLGRRLRLERDTGRVTLRA